MRKISKVVLLVAPVLLATCGCASKPAWISQKSDSQSAEEVTSERTERLLNVAKKYESSGKPDVAYQLYKHIANQNPHCAVARSRMAALAPVKEDSQIQLASKSSEEKTSLASNPSKSENLREEQVYKPRPQRKVVEVDWEEAKRQARLQTLTAEVDKKKVNNIELSYAAVSKPSEKRPSETSIPEKTPKTQWLEPKVAESKTVFPSKDSTSAEQIVQPISSSQEFNETKRSIAKADPPEMSQAWWDVEIADQVHQPLPETTLAVKKSEKPKVAKPSVSIAESVVTQNTATKIAKPIATAIITEKIAEPIVTETLVERNEPVLVQAVASVQDLCKEDASEDLIQVVALLDCPEPEVRIAGLIELGIKGADALSTSPAVRALLNDHDAMVRAHAAGTVRDIEGNNADSVRHLASLLNEKDQGVVRLSCYLLGQMGADARPAVEELKQIRDTKTGLTSLHAAEALTRIVPAETKSYGVLKNALFCDDAECRVFAAVSLGGVYDEAGHMAALALTDALSSKDADVRASAALSLGGLGKHAEIAVEQLQEISESDRPEVRDAALTALACLGR